MGAITGRMPTNYLQKFYSVSLLGGQIHAWFSAGDGVASIATEETYNDGMVHSVSVLKILKL